jgi:hypothetical protein
MIRFTWDEFNNKWGVRFEDIKHILYFINSYHKTKLELIGFEFESSEKIEDVQKEWLCLLNNLTHPDDLSFFKPYWVPIAKNRNDLFIDLSSKNYYLFEARFFYFEIQWYKTFYTKSINELLMLLSDNNDDIEIKQFRLRNLDENKEILDLLVEIYIDN